VKIPGTSGECPSDDNRQESRSFLGNATREIIRNLNTPTNPISQICGPGEWRRVFYLNTSRSDQICPDQWSLVTSPVRGCTGANSLRRTAFSDDNIIRAYSKVCGRIIGEGTRTPDAFHRSPTLTIEENYLDGVSVTHGSSGSRTHIWSFAAEHNLVVRCPCHGSIHDIVTPPHQLKLEITTSVIEVISMDRTAFGLEKAVQVIIHAVHSTTLHTSVYSSLLQPLTGLSYESALIKLNVMKLCWCCLLKFMCSKCVTSVHP
jgi:hypothetical protein